jgi:hypothetical protein
MSANDPNAPVVKHKVSAKERLAGVKGAETWIHDLAAKHLLDTEAPIKDQPVTPTPGAPT